MEHQRVPRNTVTKRDEHWCTTGMQNRSVYPKSTRDEAHFPFIGSIAIPCSTEYSTGGLISLRKLQRFSETAASSLYEHSFQHSSVKNVPCTIYRHKMIADFLLWLKIWANFPPAPQVEFSLSNRYVRGTLCFLSQVEWSARDPYYHFNHKCNVGC